MSRSFKKTPIQGNGRGSEKLDKRFANRSLRRSTTMALGSECEEELLPIMKEVSDLWSFVKDGKHYFGGLKNDVDPYHRKMYKKDMRK